MSIAVTEEHRALADSVAGAVARHLPVDLARRVTAGETGEAVPAARSALAAQGLLGIHLPEEHGGSGYGLEELAVVVEQLGRSLAPGPIVPSLLAAAVIDRAGGAAAKALLPGLADGSRAAAVALTGGTIRAEAGPAGYRLSGSIRPVVGAAEADLLVLPATVGDGERWIAVDAADAAVEPLTSLDATRRAAAVTVDGVSVVDERVLDGITTDVVRALAVVVLGAESTGLAGWALDTAVEYAKVREQFGRPIGQFQGVKHRCAEMLVRVEEARAAVWDAARAVADDDEAALATAIAGAVAPESAHRNALECIQLLGGIGFTWEHDAHLFLRRATSNRQLLGRPEAFRRDVAELALDGHRRMLHLDLGGDEAERVRAEVRDFVASLDGLDDAAARVRLAASGYQVPHWPQPWGRDASPVAQLVIDEELAAGGVKRPNIFIGGWILPTIIAYGTPEQQEQFILPTLRGEIVWCQLFSEPGAGSDLASLSTRADKVAGGWRINGQKVWTSLAHQSDWGLLIARTDPDAPKHDGITAFLLDMQHTDGIDVRPLREMTGNELFNEVYLDDVFVPDAMVVGPVNGGWRAARNTLANERVAMSSGSAMGSGVEGVLASFPGSSLADDPVARDRLGALVAEGQVLGLLGHRTTLAQLSGVEPGASSSVRKLVGGHHARDCAEFGVELLGPEGVTAEGTAGAATFTYLQAQCLTIAGGTTNVQLNVIAERLLGLPRDDAK